MIRSGLVYKYGIGFWGPNGHDAIWHLSLINQLKQKIPPLNPIFSGTTLSNYHWGFDLLVAYLSKFLYIDSLILYFQILPIVFSLLIGYLSFKLSYLVTKKFYVSLLFVIFNYFASSLGWIYTLIQKGKIEGESLFWSMQSVSTLLNPPYALSLIFLLIGLILWFKYKNSNRVLTSILLGIFFSLLSFIKIYSGILIGISLSFYWLFKIIHDHKFSKFNFYLCLSTGIFSLLILKLLGVLSNNSMLEYKPFWFLNSMIESTDKLFLPKLASFKNNQTNFFVDVFIKVFLIFIFLIGNMGIRVLGVIPILKKKIYRLDSDFKLLLNFIFIFSFFIPLLFIQKGTAWNTIQFFYYFLFFSNFYLAYFLIYKYKKSKIFFFVLLFLVCFGSIGTLKDYFGNPPPSYLPTKEITALSFLKKQPSGNVLSFPYNKYLKNNLLTPIPLYAYETTAYISAFSQKPSYLEDEMNLEITGYDWKYRKSETEKYFSTNDIFYARGFLLNNNIDYIYLLENQTHKLNEFDLQIDNIYNNDGIKIYKVRK